MLRAALLVVALASCTATRGAECSDTAPCAMPYVCASTSSAAQRRCLLPCAADPQAACLMPVSVGMLCADGSVCTETDVGAVCYFVGRIRLGDPCPSTSCNPETEVCACEPGAICHEGICRQVCMAHGRCPDTPGIVDAGPTVALCRETEVCTDGVCIGPATDAGP